MLGSIATAGLDVVFPARCVACGSGAVANAAHPWCAGCQHDLDLFDRPVCQRCSTPLARPDLTADDCPACREEKWRFDRVIALGPYTGLLRRLVLDAKRPAGEPAAVALGRMLAERAAADLAPDAVVAPVPSHWRRRLVRRADGVEALARSFARAVGIPFCRALRRTRPTRRQTEVAPSNRVANVRAAFAASGRPGVAAREVVLVDDIFTTGATCNAAALALRQAGARRVVVVVTAKRLGSP